MRHGVHPTRFDSYHLVISDRMWNGLDIFRRIVEIYGFADDHNPGNHKLVKSLNILRDISWSWRVLLDTPGEFGWYKKSGDLDVISAGCAGVAL